MTVCHMCLCSLNATYATNNIFIHLCMILIPKSFIILKKVLLWEFSSEFSEDELGPSVNFAFS